jgi:hypothetical protein
MYSASAPQPLRRGGNLDSESSLLGAIIELSNSSGNMMNDHKSSRMEDEGISTVHGSPHNQYGTGGMTGYELRDTSQQELPQPLLTM